MFIFLFTHCGKSNITTGEDTKANKQPSRQPLTSGEFGESMPCPINIIPGQRLGLIRIGMARSEVLKLGSVMMKKDGRLAMGKKGEYDVAFSKDEVAAVTVKTLLAKAGCLQIRGKSIPIPPISKEELNAIGNNQDLSSKYIKELGKYYETVLSFFENCEKKDLSKEPEHCKNIRTLGAFKDYPECTPPMSSGTFTNCENSGVVVSWGGLDVNITVAKSKTK
jgi:hypothetical protein